MLAVLRLCLSISCALWLTSYSAAASSDDTYRTIAQSIEYANGKGIAQISSGRFLGKRGDLKFNLINLQATEFSFAFDYQAGVINSGTIDFLDKSIVLVVSQNDLCAAVEIQKVAIRRAGHLDEVNSKFRVLVGHADCRNPKLEFASAAAGLFLLPLMPKDFFNTSWYDWHADLHKCPAETCVGSEGSPLALFIKELIFIPDPKSPGLRVDLAEDSPINFGQANEFTLGSGSKFVFKVLSISLEKKSINASLKEIVFSLKKGEVSANGLHLNLAPGSTFRATNFFIDSANDAVAIEGGVIEDKVGRLDAGSRISIANGPDLPPSQITIASGNIYLYDIIMGVNRGNVSFSAGGGTLGASISSADLRLGKGLRITLGAADINLSLKCPAGSPPSCRPFDSPYGRPLVTLGEIQPLALTGLGGSYQADPLGEIRLESSQIWTDVLIFDSRNARAPVVGAITRIKLLIAAQSLVLGPGLVLDATSGTIAGEDLVIAANDGLPAGDLRFQAKIASFTAEGLGKIVTVRGASEMSALLQREKGVNNASVHILSGNITAKFNATIANGGASEGRLAITDLNIYRGNGGGRLTLEIPNLTMDRFIPGSENRDGFVVGDVRTIVNEQTLAARITTPIEVRDKKIEVHGGKWSMERVEFPVEAKLSLSNGELVQAKVESAGETVCTVRVSLPFANYQVKFSGSLNMADGKLGFHSTPFVISPFPQPTIDGKTCKRAVTILCGLIGGTTLGPFGAVGAAYACNDRFSIAQGKFQDELNDMVSKGIASTRFDIGP